MSVGHGRRRCLRGLVSRDSRQTRCHAGRQTGGQSGGHARRQTGHRCATPPQALSRRSARRTSASNSFELAVAAAGSARSTRQAPGSSVASCGSCRTLAVTCRRRRDTAWRVTALPTAFETTSPMRGPPVNVPPWTYRYTTTVRVPFFLPRRTVSPKSKVDRRRCSGESTAVVLVSACVTRRRSCGPCGDGPRRWRGRRGCSCERGSRAYERDDGCWAGKYACPWPRYSLLQVVLIVRRDRIPAGLWCSPVGAEDRDCGRWGWDGNGTRRYLALSLRPVTVLSETVMPDRSPIGRDSRSVTRRRSKPYVVLGRISKSDTEEHRGTTRGKQKYTFVI